MHLQEIKELVSLSLDPAKRKEAEAKSQRLEGSSEEVFGLLEFIADSAEPAQSMGAIFLKISVSKSLNHLDGLVLKEACRLILNPSLVSVERTHLLLCDTLALMNRKLDSSDVELLVEMLSPVDREETVRILHMIGAYALKYRTLTRSNELYLDIIAVIGLVGPKLLALAETIAATGTQPRCRSLYTALFEVFLSLITQDLPDFVEENILPFVSCLMNGCDLTRDNDAILMFSVLDVLCRRFVDAFEDASIFLTHSFKVFEVLDTLSERVQTLFLKYFTGLLENGAFAHFRVSNAQDVIEALLPRVSHFEDVDEPLEFTRVVFSPDMNLQRCIAAEAITELVLSNPQTHSYILEKASDPRAYPSVLYLTSFTLRASPQTHASKIACSLVEGVVQSLLQQREGPANEEAALALFCQLSLMAMVVSTGRYGLDRETGARLFVKVLGMLEPSEEYEYIRYAGSNLIALLARNFTDQTVVVERRICEYLLKATVCSPPNEFLAPALFEALRAGSSGDVGLFVRECSNKLIGSIDTAGDFREARGLWDIVSLGALSKDPQCVRLAFETAKEALSRDASEWFVFGLQVVSLCALLSEDAEALESLNYFISNQEVWEVSDLSESLAFCVVVLCYKGWGGMASRAAALFEFLVSRNDRGAYVLARYLPRAESLLVLRQVASFSPCEYLLALRMHAFIEDSVLKKSVGALLAQPSIQEQDTALFLGALRAVSGREALLGEKPQMEAIIHRLLARGDSLKGAGVHSLSIIDRVFAKHAGH
ncbi:hypothetical protein NEDG_00477 [Nematocida displodere]|uniref:Uncharacterized protein n=1 Tax=Nematocida displodere TaxID=1805483 RepID=A0A177ELL8_9MICR|nr:hypothetical protein NEDG_00477 [Nematocida displodere]